MIVVACRQVKGVLLVVNNTCHLAGAREPFQQAMGACLTLERDETPSNRAITDALEELKVGDGLNSYFSQSCSIIINAITYFEFNYTLRSVSIRLVPRSQKKIRNPGFAESMVWALHGSWTFCCHFAVKPWKPRTSNMSYVARS